MMIISLLMVTMITHTPIPTHIPTHIPTITKIYLTNLDINTLEDFTCEKPYFYFIFIMMHKYVLFLSINIIKLIAIINYLLPILPKDCILIESNSKRNLPPSKESNKPSNESKHEQHYYDKL